MTVILYSQNLTLNCLNKRIIMRIKTGLKLSTINFTSRIGCLTGLLVSRDCLSQIVKSLSKMVKNWSKLSYIYLVLFFFTGK